MPANPNQNESTNQPINTNAYTTPQSSQRNSTDPFGPSPFENPARTDHIVGRGAQGGALMGGSSSSGGYFSRGIHPLEFLQDSRLGTLTNTGCRISMFQI